MLGASEAELRGQYPDLWFKHGFVIGDRLRKRAWEDVSVGAPIYWRTWQKELFTHLMQQNDRRICFVIDEEGGCGKSVLVSLIENEVKTWISTGGKYSDLAFSYKEPDYEVAIFDLARQNLEKGDFYPYGFAEGLKNGRIFSAKYASEAKRFYAPKVLWLANHSPDRSKLTDDRYCVHLISHRSDMTLTTLHPPNDPTEAPLVGIDLNELIDEIDI
nr:MAG: hypothetical protein [Skomarfal virus 51]